MRHNRSKSRETVSNEFNIDDRINHLIYVLGRKQKNKHEAIY